MKSTLRKMTKVALVTAIAGISLAGPVMAADVHKVQSGESLWSIARKHDLDVDTLARINNISDISRIREGMELVLKETPKSYKVSSGETLWSIARKLGVSYQDLVELNNLQNPNRIYAGMQIQIPGSAAVQSISQRQFIWPLKARISSRFGQRWGKMHEGIDLSVPVGRNIVAAASGKVVLSGWISGYGHTIIVEHENGYRTLYGHNSKLLARSGEWVKQGEVIALSGNSGRSTGPHLHFEIQKDGRPVDPLKYLD